jgi:hypothetical protein
MRLGKFIIDFGRYNYDHFECDLIPRLILIQDEDVNALSFGWLLWGIIIGIDRW